MKTVSIEQITLKNVKCHKRLTLTLGGKSATLYGDNAAGKTAVYDALCWLLTAFGSFAFMKEKIFEIKAVGISLILIFGLCAAFA